MLASIVLGLLGLAVGSFLNVVIDRVPAGQSLLSPPSHCPACGLRLQPRDLVPLLSYLALRGRCRACRASIGLRTPLVEAATAALFALAGWRWDLTPQVLPVLLLLAALVALFFTDLERQLLPNLVTYPTALALLALAPVNPLLTWPGVLPSIAQALLGGLLAGGFFLAVLLLTRGGIGMGDVKLAGVLGVAFGPALAAVALFLGIVLGGLVGVALLLTRRKRRGDMVPYGPMLVAGALVAVFFGPALSGWYLALVGLR